ncbi:MAG TPA: DUF1552 domain-containing protein [Planctomycetes bacterium]|nr:DUF1552 domain-containing protein [Planctomycetota bacterium]
MAIDRRSFLGTSALGAGGLALSPSFNHLLATTRPSEHPHRFIFIRKSNGNLPQTFSLPTFSDEQKKKDQKKEAFEADLDKHELPVWLRALEDHKSNITILHGISMTVSGGGHYSFSGCMGAYKAGRNVISGIKRTTVDFELAKLIPSPFSHVEISLTGDYSTFRSGIVPGYSAPARHQRNYCYADPQTAYDELFKSVTNTSAVDSENVLLDYLHEQEGRRLNDLNGKERMKISKHVDSIQSLRDRNEKVATLSGVISKSLPTIDKIHANGGPNASLLEKQGAFTDVLVSALTSGLTNVVTFTIDELSTPITTLPGNTSRVDLHRLGHSNDIELRDLVKASHMAQVNKIVTKLKSVPEGNGTMFDNTTIIYMPETGAGHHGPDTEAPMVIMTGDKSKLDIAGRYIRLPFHATEGHKTLSNWYTTLLNAYGNPIEHYGDYDLEMSRKKMDQTGAIEQFMA